MASTGRPRPTRDPLDHARASLPVSEAVCRGAAGLPTPPPRGSKRSRLPVAADLQRREIAIHAELRAEGSVIQTGGAGALRENDVAVREYPGGYTSSPLLHAHREGHLVGALKGESERGLRGRAALPFGLGSTRIDFDSRNRHRAPREAPERDSGRARRVLDRTTTGGSAGEQPPSSASTTTTRLGTIRAIRAHGPKSTPFRVGRPRPGARATAAVRVVDSRPTSSSDR